MLRRNLDYLGLDVGIYVAVGNRLSNLRIQIVGVQLIPGDFAGKGKLARVGVKALNIRILPLDVYVGGNLRNLGAQSVLVPAAVE